MFRVVEAIDAFWIQGERRCTKKLPEVLAVLVRPPHRSHQGPVEQNILWSTHTTRLEEPRMSLMSRRDMSWTRYVLRIRFVHIRTMPRSDLKTSELSCSNSSPTSPTHPKDKLTEGLDMALKLSDMLHACLWAPTLHANPSIFALSVRADTKLAAVILKLMG